MKIILLSIGLLINACATAQTIGICTETPQGKLNIKRSADTSQLVIDESATQTVSHPVILLRTSDGDELMRIHADNTRNLFIGYKAVLVNVPTSSSTNNVFIGNSAGLVNYSGYSNTVVGSNAFTRNTLVAYNVAIGNESLRANTEGYYNTAVGTDALTFNSTGSQNTALGFNSLASNGTGYNNTSIGTLALLRNTVGVSNTALGTAAMQNNRAGGNNTAMGVNTLFNSNGVDASYNTAIGIATLYNTTNTQYNTALGHNAGSRYDNGYNNVFLGANTDVNGAGYYNVIAIGQSTVCTASSQVTIGNGATNSYRAYANWSNISDGRFKKNIQENVPGLAFITQLQPVTYNLNATDLDNFLHGGDNTLQSNVNTAGAKTGNSERTAAAVPDEKAKAAITKALQQKEQLTQTGFVAQEVEATAKKMSFNFWGIDAPVNDKDVYGLRYAEFVVPLVKAVQEQQQQIKSLQKNNQAQKDTNALLQKQINELKSLIKK